MEKINRIKLHYNFTTEDAKNLGSLGPELAAFGDEFVEAFYNHIRHFEDTPKFLKNDEVIARHKKGLRHWFDSFFVGLYDAKYFKELERVGTAHVKINLSAHYVNAAMHFVKGFLIQLVARVEKDLDELPYMTRSVEKLCDINLDVLTSSYIEEEVRVISFSHRVESLLIQLARRFSHVLNLVLVLGLVVLGFMVLGLFAYDVTHLFQGDIEKGLLSTLGSLLMLWVVIELIDTEIRHLQGAKFKVMIFVSVALVAVIRKLLVTSLSAEEVGAQVSLIAALAVLGVVYWLIAKVEQD